MANEKRLIDANAIKYRKKDEYCGNGNCRPIRYALDIDIEEMPTVDAVEVVHGRWQERKVIFMDNEVLLGYRCSNCNLTYDAETNYCPNCGAKMDGGAR